jgi:hypothetical protein
MLSYFQGIYAYALKNKLSTPQYFANYLDRIK